MCAPSGFFIIALFGTLHKWRATNSNGKVAFLYNGNAQRDVFLVPPIESSDPIRRTWLSLTIAYELVNSDAKCQVVSV